MPLLPAMLILVSCFTHAAWNLLARHRREEVTFFRRMVLPLALGMIGVVVLWVPHSFPPHTWLYVIPSGLICGTWHICALAAYLVVQKLHHPGDPPAERCGWATGAVRAVLGLFAYTLVLWAFQLAAHAGYLVAFRQFSIAVGVVAAIMHTEAGAHVRLPATAAIVGGQAVLIIWG